MDISKGRKSTNIEDRTTPLGDLIYSAITRFQHENADLPPKVLAGPSRDALEVIHDAIRYDMLKTGRDPGNDYYKALFRGSYQPDERRPIGYFLRDQNPRAVDAKPLSDVSAARLPWQEDRIPLNRDEGRIFTHTGPTRRP